MTRTKPTSPFGIIAHRGISLVSSDAYKLDQTLYKNLSKQIEHRWNKIYFYITILHWIKRLIHAQYSSHSQTAQSAIRTHWVKYVTQQITVYFHTYEQKHVYMLLQVQTQTMLYVSVDGYYYELEYVQITLQRRNSGAFRSN
jgi:hypothetical protein